jgi:hypothetical protein
LRALHRCLLYDTGAAGAARFLDEPRFQRLLPPLVAHLGLAPPPAAAAAMEPDHESGGCWLLGLRAHACSRLRVPVCALGMVGWGLEGMGEVFSILAGNALAFSVLAPDRAERSVGRRWAPTGHHPPAPGGGPCA